MKLGILLFSNNIFDIVVYILEFREMLYMGKSKFNLF